MNHHHRLNCHLLAIDPTATDSEQQLSEAIKTLISERDHWKANHDNQVELKRIISSRPDLAERAALVQELIAERDEIKTALTAAEQKADAALLAAVQQGISAAPDRILTSEVLGAIRMPFPASKFATFARAFPRDSRCTQRGEWLLIIQP